MTFLRDAATVVAAADLADSACRDPADVPVLGTALAGAATLLITVDLYILTLEPFEGTANGRPREFWERTR